MTTSTSRVPTKRQYEQLLMLGGGGAWLSVTKKECNPLLSHGWVTADWKPPYYQWVRITPDGLHALAHAVEKFGLQDLAPVVTVRICSDCGREWRPACRCGCRSWRYDTREAA